MEPIRSSSIVTVILFILSAPLLLPCDAKLSPTFYNTTCPNALPTIRAYIRRAVSRDRRMAASLIRLHFHDCFVQGCDASILLDEQTPDSERTAKPNNNSARGYEVIEAAKREVEAMCPGLVSCADILTVAARDASVAVGGPSWNLRLGRRDSTTANRTRANIDLPHPFVDLNVLIKSFVRKGLSERDMVALSGSHTIGASQCQFFRRRIYSNGTNIDAGFASMRRHQCPPSAGSRDCNMAPLDLVTPNSFDNNFFRNLVQRRGLLHTDQVLYNGGSTDNIVLEYSRNQQIFFSDFASAMVRMGEIDPLTGQKGVIRRVCSSIN